MKRYILRKMVYALMVLYIIATVNFMIFQVFSPLDPINTLWDPRLPVEYKEVLRHQFGFDQPILTRYAKYVVNLFTFNFGYSFVTRKPVIQEIAVRLPNTLLLLGSALVLSVLAGILLGVLAASRRGTKVDVLVIGSGLFAWAAPIFFIQLFLVLFLAYYNRLFPVGKMTQVPPPTDFLAFVADVLYHLALPVTSLVLAQFGFWALYTRNMMLEALTQDYTVTARAKGLKERSVLFGYAFRTILPPVTTMLLLAIPSLITGSIITEYVFSWPGMGKWLLDSMRTYDFPAVQALFFFYAILTIGANFASDLLYGWLDPRIRVGVRR